jgi:transcriptional regulator with XRE-family HTH domain
MASIQNLVHHMTPQDKQFYRDLGKRIAQFRKTQGLTQVQLAGILGIAQQTMAHYEGGTLRVAVSLLPPLEKALDVTIAELINEHEATKSKRGPVSKLEQQVTQIRELSRAKQKFVSEMLDTVLHQANA